ncbi:MAG: PD40 domain-containing protein [Chloroflexota bacterium]|nr:MAG: PD40 domain-containing protein [Chloroflexota bacterium]
MKMREWMVAAAGLLTGVLLLLAWLSPRIKDRQPEGEALSAWTPIAITLNRPVRPETVAGRFELSPEVNGQLRIEGDQVVFQPAEALNYGRTYTVTLRPGASGTNRLPMLRGADWSFEVRPPRLLYLRQEGDIANLWLLESDGSDRQLTSEPGGVWDFAALPGGRGVVYSAFDEDGSLDLVLLTAGGGRELLLDCAGALCRSPVVQPFGRWLAYERQALDGDLLASELWLLDLASGETSPAPVPGDLAAAGFAAPLGRFPRWSPDGRYLAFYKPDANMVIIHDFAADDAGSASFTPATVTIPANLEAMGDWSPDSRRLAYSELAFGETEAHEHDDGAGAVISHTRPSLYNHVVVADIPDETVGDLSAGLEVDEGRPAWHPNGQALAMTRTSTGGGRQIWLVPLDGRPATQLTDDPLFDHTALSWSPDGRSLAYMRVPRPSATGSAIPVLMVIDLETGQAESIAEAAFTPAWWP